jgi:phenylpyruvate tautomerase PptA (4-oxalocrotonate tautomerase family)
VYSKERDDKDDLRLFQPYTFIEILEKYYEDLKNNDVIEKVTSILKDFLEENSERVSVFMKEKVLDLLGIEELKPYFQEKFNEYI